MALFRVCEGTKKANSQNTDLAADPRQAGRGSCREYRGSIEGGKNCHKRPEQRQRLFQPLIHADHADPWLAGQAGQAGWMGSLFQMALNQNSLTMRNSV